MLIAIPFNQTAIQLFLRNARNVTEISLSFWLIFSMLPLSYFGMLFAGEDFGFMKDFDSTDWLLSVFIGISTVLSQTARAKATHYEISAKLTVLNYF